MTFKAAQTDKKNAALRRLTGLIEEVLKQGSGPVAGSVREEERLDFWASISELIEKLKVSLL